MKLPLKPNTQDKELKDRIDLRKLLGRFYERGEEVIWVGDSSPVKQPFNVFHTISFLCGVLGAIVIIVSTGISDIYAFFSFIIIYALSFLILFIASRVRTNRLSNRTNLITSERVLTFDGINLSHRSIGSVFYSKKEDDKIIFYDQTQGTIVYREIHRFEKLENAQEGHGEFYKIWTEKGPYGKLEQSLKEIMERKGFQSKNDIVKNANTLTFNGSANGSPCIVSVFGILPVRNIEVQVTCPNNENNFLLLYGQHASKQQDEDVEINDPEFDDSFIIQSDSRSFLESALTDSAKQYMLNCVGSAVCYYQFGTVGEVTKEKGVDTRSQFTDSEDILDFQLLEPSADKKKTPTMRTDAKKGESTSLRLVCRPDSSMQFNFEFMGRLLENCVDSTVELGKGIHDYAK